MKLVFRVENINESENETVCYLGGNVEQLHQLKKKDITLYNHTELLHNTAEEIKYNFIDYIVSIGKKQNNAVIWWATRIASKSNLQTDFFFLVCLIIVAKTICEKKLSDVLVVDDERLFLTLKNNFVFDKIIATDAIMIYRKNKVKSFIYSIVIRILFLFNTLRYNVRAKKYLSKTFNNDSVFLSSWIEERSFNKNGRYEDAYLTGLIEIETLQQKWLFHTYYTNPTHISKLSSEYKQTGLSAFSSLWKVLRSVVSVANVRSLSPFMDLDISVLWNAEMQRENWHESYFQNVHDYYCRVDFHQKARGRYIYVYENQPHEKLMLLAAKLHKDSLTFIGYQHSWQCNLLLTEVTTEEELSYMPVPDVLLVNSESHKEYFEQFYRGKVKVFNGGALRYQHKDIQKKERSEKRILGIMLPSDYSQAIELIDDINNHEQKSFEIVVKCHPDMKFSADTFRDEITVFDGSAIEFYQSVDAIVYRSSTSGLEAYSYGLKVFKFVGLCLDLEVGENIFEPHVISSISETEHIYWNSHDPIDVFSNVNKDVWRRVISGEPIV